MTRNVERGLHRIIYGMSIYVILAASAIHWHSFCAIYCVGVCMSWKETWKQLLGVGIRGGGGGGGG